MRWLAAAALLAVSPAWAQTQPNQTQPNQTQPNQTQPNQAQPNQAQPNQAQPNQTQPQSQADWLPRTTAELRLLDKVTAQPSPLEVKVGQSATFGTLTITLRSCVTRPPDQPADSAAYFAITDTRASGRGFNGWILANTPAVSMFEDPIYDLRLVACR